MCGGDANNTATGHGLHTIPIFSEQQFMIRLTATDQSDKCGKMSETLRNTLFLCEATLVKCNTQKSGDSNWVRTDGFGQLKQINVGNKPADC